MECNTFIAELKTPVVGFEIEAASLCSALRKLEDDRHLRGRRYRLEVVLTLLILGKLAGETTLQGITEWVRLRTALLCPVLKLSGRRLPCANTYRYVCERIDVRQLNTLLAQFFIRARRKQHQAEVSRSRAGRQWVMDGKALKGTLGHAAPNQNPVFLLSVYDLTTQVVLKQAQVSQKKNEISSAPTLLSDLSLKGVVITADALHTQREWCRLVLRKEGDYLLIAKKNQLGLMNDIAFLFDGEKADWLEQGRAEVVNKGHGRHEVRQLTVSNQLKDYLGPDWVGVEQVFRLERTITRKGVTTTEVVYGLTSLPAEVAAPERLLKLIRNHWQIENRLHWRRDVTMGEDACQVRIGQVPEVLASLNNAVLSLLDFLKVPNVAAKMREFSAKPVLALRLLILKC
jgi:predicted transposase YbfD/YdcC